MSPHAAALSTLESIFPDRNQDELLRFLQASSYNVERACSALLQGDHALFRHGDRLSESKRKRQRASDVGLKAWLGRVGDEQAQDRTVAKQHDSSDQADKRQKINVQHNVKSAFEVMQQSATTAKTATTSAATTATATQNLPVLRLTNDKMIREHTQDLITLIPNVLPTELASRLFLSMISESRSWERNRWYMFDREVVSPHTTSFYVAVPPDSDNKAAFSANATHWYNGEVRSSQPFTLEMNEAREVVGSLVRTILSGRQRHRLEWQGEWVPNVSAANCYTGKDEGVGWHSDVLTHLGPYPTIASLSLGVARPFRLRPFKPLANGQQRTLEIVLPHNSLCIMHGGCQELFKHSIPPVAGMDLFRLPGSQQSFRERINMTFRHYRPDFASLDSTISLGTPKGLMRNPAYTGTPICPCGTPTVLRPDGKGRARANLDARQPSSTLGKKDDELLFFWTCSHGQQNEGKTCGYFRLLDMKKEARGQRFFVADKSE
ncbi:hypothetical protein ACM66B_000022 [Microbotryomycetes sp. NB124-2]